MALGVILGLAGLSCATGSGPEVNIHGRVMAQDDRTGVPCDLVINSSAEPFYTPIHLQLTTGDSLTYVMTPSEPVPGMHLVVRCMGYQPLLRKFDLRPHKDVDLETLVVIPEVAQQSAK